MKKRWIALFVMMCMFVLAACSNDEATKNDDAGKNVEQSSAFPVTVKDALGNEVTLDKAPERIVTLAPVNTEILYGLGLGDQIVGRTDNDNYPPEVAEKPSVGDLNFSAEKVIALNPDIVFIHESGMYGTEAQMEQFAASGVKVFVVKNAQSMEEIFATFEDIGKVTGKVEEAKKLVQQVKDEIAAVQKKVEGMEKRSAFIVVGAQPDIYVVGKDNYMDEMLGLIGAENKVTVSGWPMYSPEEFAAANPDAILLTYESDIDAIKGNEAFREMAAVKSGALSLIDGDTTSRQGPRIAQGLESIAKAVYPEAFK